MGRGRRPTTTLRRRWLPATCRWFSGALTREHANSSQILRVKVTSESRLSTTTRRSWSPQRPIAQTSVTGRGRPQCEVARAAAQLAGAPLTTGVVELSESARLRNPFGTHSAGSASMPMTLRLPPEAASSTAYLDCELCPRAYRRGTPSFRSFGACSHPLHVCISPPGEVTIVSGEFHTSRHSSCSGGDHCHSGSADCLSSQCGPSRCSPTAPSAAVLSRYARLVSCHTRRRSLRHHSDLVDRRYLPRWFPMRCVAAHWSARSRRHDQHSRWRSTRR